MANNIYINVAITYFRSREPWARLVQQVGDGALETTKLPVEKAQKLMWELKLAGGKMEVNSNWFDSGICSRTCHIFLPM